MATKSMATKSRDYSTFTPLVIPKYFSSSESCQVVAIYPEALSDSPEDNVMLMFPGDQAGSSPKRVVTERVGDRTLLFQTPEYKMSFSGRNTIGVLPILHSQAGGTTELKPFSLAVKNPMKNIIELCLNLSTNEAVLPVLVTLMLHCKGDPEKSNFQDPQFDRILSTLVGSRPPSSSISIKDIVLPKRKGSKKMSDLVDLCKEYKLTSTECQVVKGKHGRKLSIATAERTRPAGASGFYVNVTPLSDCGLSISEPNLSAELESGSADTGPHANENLKGEAEAVYRVVQNVNPSDPQYLTLKVGEEVYVLKTLPTNRWYGICGDQCGYFDSTNVKLLRILTKRQTVPREKADSSTCSSQPMKGSFHLRQPLVRHPEYQNTFIASSSEDSVGEVEGLRWNLNQGRSVSTDAGLDRTGIGFQPILLQSAVNAAVKEPPSPLVNRKVAILPSKPNRGALGGNSSDSGNATASSRSRPPPLPSHPASSSDELGPQATKVMPSAAELADVRPKPRPRQRKPPAHSSDFVQDPGTSPKHFEDHVYEDIDKVMPPIKIPPRNVPRQSNAGHNVVHNAGAATIPPKPPLKPASSRKISPPTEATLQAELRQKLSREQVNWSSDTDTAV